MNIRSEEDNTKNTEYPGAASTSSLLWFTTRHALLWNFSGPSKLNDCSDFLPGYTVGNKPSDRKVRLLKAPEGAVMSQNGFK